MKTVVITGAAGNLGQRLVPHLEARGHLVRPVDRVPITHQHAVVADLSRTGAWCDSFAGADTLVHLTAAPAGAPGSDLVTNNIDPVLHVVHAASVHGVGRIVYASSVWANRGRWAAGELITAAAADPGDSAYGMTKAMGERALAASVAVSGVTGIAVRIGGRPPGDSPPIYLDEWEAACWLGPRDFLDGLTRAVEIELDGFHVVNLVSDNPAGRWSLHEAREVLGFIPSERYAPRAAPSRRSWLRTRQRP